ncbi:MAG: VIT1/CCC1 family protein [bacterium]|nr:VIT1/CCC1 family protein [bacterium]
MPIDPQLKKKLLIFQRNEITEFVVYSRLAEAFAQSKNGDILRHAASDELRHSAILERYTGVSVKPNPFIVMLFAAIARLFGLTFGLKLMELGEERTQKAYLEIASSVPEIKQIIHEEQTHEKALFELIDDNRLKYVGSIVLGLNDALIELTGALVGFTFALQNATLVTVAGLITGVAASFSMAASEYLSTKSEKAQRNPLKAAIYTGVAYLGVVLLLISPYMLFGNLYASLSAAFVIAVAIIASFSFYTAVAQGASFRHRFGEMFFLSLGVAVLTFTLGQVIRKFVGIEF